MPYLVGSSYIGGACGTFELNNLHQYTNTNMQCRITITGRNVTNVLFLAEGSRIESFTVIAGTIVGVPALLIAIWWCVR